MRACTSHHISYFRPSWYPRGLEVGAEGARHERGPPPLSQRHGIPRACSGASCGTLVERRTCSGFPPRSETARKKRQSASVTQGCVRLAAVTRSPLFHPYACTLVQAVVAGVKTSGLPHIIWPGVPRPFLFRVINCRLQATCQSRISRSFPPDQCCSRQAGPCFLEGKTPFARFMGFSSLFDHDLRKPGPRRDGTDASNT